jgi:endoglucanase
VELLTQRQLVFIFPAIRSGNDGAGQMRHFVNDDGFNMFRLPVGWQYLLNNALGPVNQANLNEYDTLVQACLGTGAHCIIDIHNYARWNGAVSCSLLSCCLKLSLLISSGRSQIIGQGGPTNAQFASTWSTIAAKYANSPKVVFGV